MIKPEELNTSILNQLSSEIIILDQSLKSIWVNESALNNGWSIQQNRDLITDQYPLEKNKALIDMLNSTVLKTGSFTKRDLELVSKDGEKRIVDLTAVKSTILFSPSFETNSRSLLVNEPVFKTVELSMSINALFFSSGY